MERAEYHRQKAGRDIQRRTRRSASTIRGAAPDTTIGRAAADRTGARPYRATRSENASRCASRERVPATRCENASPGTPIRQYADTLPLPAAHFEPNDVTIICETVHQGLFAEMESIRPHSGSNPTLLCLTNVYFGQRCRELRNGAMRNSARDHSLFLNSRVLECLSA